MTDGKKRLLRCLAAGALGLGIFSMAFSFLKGQGNHAASIGIIGGADGPTAIFVTGPNWASYVIPGVLAALGICGLLWLKHRKK